ncbi:MAG TPA: MerR family transcriptional regulator [Acidimicrobiales bacterium]|nr:MerR family transcriptional regulator [Acidimicrobiales bacterium]
MTLTITELAAELDVRSDTLRYYERAKLIGSAGRTSSNYRLYDEATAERVRFIKQCQRSGLRLKDILELLAVMDQGNCPCGHTAEIVTARLDAVDRELESLRALRGRLRRLQRDNEGCRATSGADWACAVAAKGRR